MKTLLLSLLVALQAHAVQPAVTVPGPVLDGAPCGVKVTGLEPGQTVRVHAVRTHMKWARQGNEWRQVRQPLHAWAEFSASDDGVVDVDGARAVQGTYTGVDSLGLLRTGLPVGHDELAAVLFDPSWLDGAAARQINLIVESAGKVAARSSLELLAEAPGLQVEEVTGESFHAVFARPAGDDVLTPVILLHGSEGGSREKARQFAGQFASRGFAALALNYFAYPHESIDGVPTEHVEIPIEVVSRAKAWLDERDDVDHARLALYGVSKGAELALVAATNFPWIDAVVAVVPSDVVWEGYTNHSQPMASSWSLDGRPLAYIPLFPFDERMEGLYRTNTERYSRSRAFNKERVPDARIPIEKTNARILLLASDRDEVWASGDMARSLVEHMVAAGKADKVHVCIYPRAGHQIAGVGTFPIWLYGVQGDEPWDKDVRAEGAAAADAWRRTVDFLQTP